MRTPPTATKPDCAVQVLVELAVTPDRPIAGRPTTPMFACCTFEMEVTGPGPAATFAHTPTRSRMTPDT